MEIKLKIYEMLADTQVELELVDLLLSRLECFSIELSDSDCFLVVFSLIKSYTEILNFCGVISVPKELYYTLVDLSIADILTSFKACNKLGFEDVSSVKIGDTSVTFNGDNIDNVIYKFYSNGKDELVCYRKLRW